MARVGCRLETSYYTNHGSKPQHLDPELIVSATQQQATHLILPASKQASKQTKEPRPSGHVDEMFDTICIHKRMQQLNTYTKFSVSTKTECNLIHTLNVAPLR